jgi:hypothetical protein
LLLQKRKEKKRKEKKGKRKEKRKGKEKKRKEKKGKEKKNKEGKKDIRSTYCSYSYISKMHVQTQLYYGTNKETVRNVVQLLTAFKKKAPTKKSLPISNLMVPSI